MTAPPGRDPYRLDGKTALVTGGASGIGEAIARTFASSGAMVRIIDMDGPRSQSVAEDIRGHGGAAEAHCCDVSVGSEVTRVLGAILAHDPVHILVNNAGVAHIGNLENTSESDLDRLFAINVKGVYHCLTACVPYLKSQGGGVILNLASVAAETGLADRFAYSITKGAVRSLTFSVARDYIQHNIRCNCVSPARVHTPFVDGYLTMHFPGREVEMMDRLAKTQPIGRMGEPGEIAMLALFLCSDAARFITGSDYPIDGGFLRLHG